MGFIDTAKDLINAQKHRTNVLYDFSAVKKAKLYEYQGSPGSTTKFEYKPTNVCYRLQLNPNKITEFTGAKRKLPKSVKPGQMYYPCESYSHGGGDPDYMEIPLRYDVYDEYMVATADGLLQGYTKDFDLRSEETTSLQALVNAASDPTKAYYFKWGPFEYFGYIKDLKFEYTAFSRFGNPLKGEGNLTLGKTGYIEEGNGKTTDFQKSNIQAIAEENKLNLLDKAENIKIRALTGGSQALR